MKKSEIERLEAYAEFKDNMDIKYFHEFPYPHYRAPHDWWWEKKVRIIDMLKATFWIVVCIIWVSYVFAIAGAFGG